MEINPFMEQIIHCERNHRIINVEKLILKTIGYDKFQQLEAKVSMEKEREEEMREKKEMEEYIDNICAKFVENGKQLI